MSHVRVFLRVFLYYEEGYVFCVDSIKYIFAQKMKLDAPQVHLREASFRVKVIKS